MVWVYCNVYKLVFFNLNYSVIIFEYEGFNDIIYCVIVIDNDNRNSSSGVFRYFIVRSVFFFSSFVFIISFITGEI